MDVSFDRKMIFNSDYLYFKSKKPCLYHWQKTISQNFGIVMQKKKKKNNDLFTSVSVVFENVLKRKKYNQITVSMPYNLNMKRLVSISSQNFSYLSLYKKPSPVVIRLLVNHLKMITATQIIQTSNNLRF